MKKPRPGKRNGYKPPQALCSICKKKNRILKKQGGKKYCRKCYKPPKHRCAICKRIRVINQNDPKIGPICIDCYERPVAICSICKKKGEIVVRTKKNELICRKCYKPPEKECFYCHRERALAIKQPATCHTCYARIYRYGTIKASKIRYKPRRK